MKRERPRRRSDDESLSHLPAGARPNNPRERVVLKECAKCARPRQGTSRVNFLCAADRPLSFWLMSNRRPNPKYLRPTTAAECHGHCDGSLLEFNLRPTHRKGAIIIILWRLPRVPGTENIKSALPTLLWCVLLRFLHVLHG